MKKFYVSIFLRVFLAGSMVFMGKAVVAQNQDSVYIVRDTRLDNPVPQTGAPYYPYGNYIAHGTNKVYGTINSNRWFWSADSLPPGLYFVRISSPGARLAGTPTAAGTFYFTVRLLVVDPFNGQLDTAYFRDSMTVLPPDIQLYAPSGLSGSGSASDPYILPPGNYGLPYDSSALGVFGASGGTAPYTFHIPSPAWGMSISSNGVLSGIPTKAGTLKFQVFAADNTSGPDSPYISAGQWYQMSVSPAPLTVTALDTSKVYGAAMPKFSATYKGFVNGDNADSLTTAPTISTTATIASPIGYYPITVSGAGDSNYTITYGPSGTLTVTPAPLTVKANDTSMLYGGTVPAFTASLTGVANAADSAAIIKQVSFTSILTPRPRVGRYLIYPAINSGVTSDSNYQISYQDGHLSINPARLTITPDSATSIYGARLIPADSLPVAYSGFVNGDNADSLMSAPVVTNSATAGAGAGTYSLTLSGAVDTNYILQYDTGIYTITRASLRIEANDTSKLYGAPMPSLSVSYSGFVNGDDSTSLTTAPTISTTATIASPIGSYPITVSRAVDANYTITYGLSGTLTVSPAPLTIIPVNDTMTYGGNVPALSARYQGFVNGDSTLQLNRLPALSTNATASSPAGGAYWIAAGGAADSNYTIRYDSGTVVINKAPLTVTANSQTMAYGGPLPAMTIQYSGFVNGDDSSSLTTRPIDTTTATSSSPVGTYPIVPGGGVAQNYSFNYVNGVLDVRQAMLTIRPDSATSAYGAAVVPDSLLTVTYSGFVHGDNAGSLTRPPVVNNSATAGAGAGGYGLTASGAVDSNYLIQYDTGVYTITPATLQVEANGASKVYGTSDPAWNYAVSGFVNGDSKSTITGSLSRAPGENVGSYPITQGTLTAGGNYVIDFIGNDLTITKAPQEISWTQTLSLGCDSGATQFQLNGTTSSGLPVIYFTADTGVATVAGDELSLVQPGTAVIIATQPGDSNHYAAPEVTDTAVYRASSLVRQHWNDVLLFDNSSDSYVQWQWYKDDDAIPGAVGQYYSAPSALNGQYYVVATDASGHTVQTCPLTITAGGAVPGGIKVFPNPTSPGSSVTLVCSYPAASLQGARMLIADMSGKIRQQITNVQPSMQVTMPAGDGIYVIKLQLANGQVASVNVLVTDSP